jgi:hypothetical protein
MKTLIIILILVILAVVFLPIFDTGGQICDGTRQDPICKAERVNLVQYIQKLLNTPPEVEQTISVVQQ